MEIVFQTREQAMESELVRLIGQEKFEKLVVFAFEYASREAELIRLKDSCETDLHYRTSFNGLCRFRRNWWVEQILEALENLSESRSKYTEMIDFKVASGPDIDRAIIENHYPELKDRLK